MGNLEKGVLLIAMGHENYFKMGVNLAASIKRNSPSLSITIITDRQYSDNLHVFDFVEIVDNLSPIKAKTKLYTLSRYEQTLYLDVDMIILPDKDIEDLFKFLSGTSFQIMNSEKGDAHSVWAGSKEIREYTKNAEDDLLVYYSEMIYFEKGPAMRQYFKAVDDMYTNSTVRGRNFAGVMADELAYILASMELRIFPKFRNWLPVFWFFRDGQDTAMQPFQLAKKYYGYSLGGNFYPSYVKAQYDNLVAYYSQVMKVTKPYKAKDKRLYLNNRSKI